MKHKNISLQFTLLTVVSVGAMLGLVVYYHDLLIPDTSSPGPITTSPISDTQDIGGVPQAQPQTSSENTLNDTETTNPTSPPISSPLSRPLPTDTTNAPEQAKIANSITVEHPYRALVTPNDPYYANITYPAWSLTTTGAPAAWDQTTGKTAVIALIDTGFALQHEDLTTQWYNNVNETGSTQEGDWCWTGVSVSKSTNNCDDDNNGYVDDWRGWNFYGKYQPSSDPCSQTGLGSYVSNNLPQAGESGDDTLYQESMACFGLDLGDPFVAVSHGTSTAGLAGAATNNGKGIATYNWNVKIMPLQALGDDGSGWTSDIVAAIYYAVDNGADIINMSLGGENRDTAMESALNYAYEQNVLVVAAAGNCGTGTELGCDPTKPGAMGYPALYPHVLAVGATDNTGKKASFSSYGPGLDVVAPGSGAIVAPLISRGSTPTDPNTFNYLNGYSGSLYGTSFASPIAASLASLILSERPAASPDDITTILNGSATKASTMNGNIYTNEYGHGIINATTATTITMSLASSSPTAPVLSQTGDYRSEHSYSTSATMSSGCTVIASTYCTISASNSKGYNRVLPYKLTGTTGKIGWQWSGSILGNDEWAIQAVQGSEKSGSYYIFAK
ncbi:hypothetical protein EOL96_01865 [Candidatus Saccharibacteria bacterium]|nr:hypothetical protein [Candidatus Saccharibacteria bacterium]